MKTKPFDLTAAMNGAPLVTREGREAKFIAYVPEAVPAKVVVLSQKTLFALDIDGRVDSSFESSNDVFLAVQTRSINGHEYPEPEKEALGYGDIYWYPKPSRESCVDRAEWNWSNTDTMLLRRGRVHLSAENAKLHAIAEILAGGGEV